MNYGGYDYSTLAVRISPAFTESGSLLKEEDDWVGPIVDSADEFVASTACDATTQLIRESNFATNLLALHAKPEIQVVSLVLDFQREVQVT
jgi:hypothetical protein